MTLHDLLNLSIRSLMDGRDNCIDFAITVPPEELATEFIDVLTDRLRQKEGVALLDRAAKGFEKGLEAKTGEVRRLEADSRLTKAQLAELTTKLAEHKKQSDTALRQSHESTANLREELKRLKHKTALYRDEAVRLGEVLSAVEKNLVDLEHVKKIDAIED